MSGHDVERKGASFSIIKKIMISLAIAASAFGLSLITDDTSFDNNIMLSVLVGGISVIVQFLHDFERRLSSVEHGQSAHAMNMERLVQSRFVKINDATRLFGRIEATQLRIDAVTQLVQHSTQIDSSAPPLIYNFAQSEVGRLSDVLKSLSEGNDVTYDGEDRDWLLGLARNAQLSIDAISLATVDAGGRGFVDGGLWTSDLGQRYLEIQRDAARRKVLIRRIFVLDRPSLAEDSELMSVYGQHHDLGIKIRILDPRTLPGTRRGGFFDFIVFDKVLSYETTPASHIEASTRPIIVSTRIIQREHTVSDRIQRFEEMWDSAVDFVRP